MRIVKLHKNYQFTTFIVSFLFHSVAFSICMAKKKSIPAKNTLTNDQRVDVIKLFENANVSILNLANHFDSSTTAIRRTNKRKKEIEDDLNSGNYNDAKTKKKIAISINKKKS